MGKLLDRINELAQKERNEGLTPAEKEEQQRLRQEYLVNFRSNFLGVLENTYLQRPDGSKEKIHRKKRH